MAVEGFEDGAQEAVSQQHAGSGHVDDGDALFGGDGFEDVFALRSARGDAGAFARRIARIQHVDREYFSGWPEAQWRGAGLCAEVGELGGFVEADDLDAASLGADLGSVVRMPSTSVQISMRSAPSPAPKMAAEKSEPPRPIVVVMPARLAAMKPPMTGTCPALSKG